MCFLSDRGNNFFSGDSSGHSHWWPVCPPARRPQAVDLEPLGIQGVSVSGRYAHRDAAGGQAFLLGHVLEPSAHDECAPDPAVLASSVPGLPGRHCSLDCYVVKPHAPGNGGRDHERPGRRCTGP